MSLTKLMKADESKYIAVSDFIELMVKHTNDSSDVVIEYLVKYSFAKGNDVKIYLKGCFNEYSYEWTLSELLANDTNKNLRPYTLSELKAEEDFARSYFLKKDIFNAKYIKVLNLNYDNLIKDTDKIDQASQQLTDVQEKIVPIASTYNDIQAPNKIYPAKSQKNITVLTDLGKHQKELITYDMFTSDQIICLILDYPPSSSSHDREFISYILWIDEASQSGELVFSKEEDSIYAQVVVDAQQVKVWLARNNYIYKGFNDHIPADPIEQVKQLTAQIAQLTTDNNELKKQLNTAHVELETAKTSQLGDDFLKTILDESHEHHAPDLRHAVQLWIDLYIHKRVGGNSHTGRADNWIGKHTSYDADITKADKNSINRIREVATPLKHFGSKRSRENKK